MEDQIILSICIPTYNRSSLLKECIDCIFRSIVGFEESVEVIISDNASTDDTSSVIRELNNNYKSLISHRNDTNIGFNRNLFLLTDVYARGVYCWVIGDDDFLDLKSIDFIVNLLKSNLSVDFVSLNFRLMKFNEFISSKSSIKAPDEEIIYNRFDTYELMIGKCFGFENIMSTFISASIFKRLPFKQESKDSLVDLNWSDFWSVFPHSYIFSSIYKNSVSVYVESNVFTANFHIKSWDDKLPIIYLNSLPQLFMYHIKLGYEMKFLILLRKSISKIGAMYLLKGSFKTVSLRSRWYFVRNFAVNIDFYKGLLIGVIRKF